MHFLIVTFEFPPDVGGVETRVKNYIKNLLAFNHKVTVLALVPRKKTRYDYLGATVYVDQPKPWRVVVQLALAARLMKDENIDSVLILTGAQTTIGMMILLYAKLRGLNTAIFLYGKDILVSRSIFIRFSIFLTDRVAVNSLATSKLLPVSPRSLYVLCPGVDVTTMRPFVLERGESNNSNEILFVGRLVARKGVDDLIRAFVQVSKYHPNSRLVIVGDGPERSRLENLSGVLGVAHRVHFTGMLIGQPLFERYRACKVFVLPSKRLIGEVEGFGMVLLEAAFFKKPAVATMSGGIPEAVLDKKTGLLVPEGNVDALAKTLTLILSDRNLQENLGQNAYQRVMEEFTWEAATKKLLDMYQQTGRSLRSNSQKTKDPP